MGLTVGDMDTDGVKLVEQREEPFHRFRPKKLHEMVAEELEEMIVAGHFAPGANLPSERELIRQFGVSRTVIRDAIRTLATKGLVDVQHGVGAIVTSNARHALMDSLRLTFRRGTFSHDEMIEVREILDDNIAALAALRATPEDINEGTEIMRRYADAAAVRPWEETVKIHQEFHLMLIRATHNRVLMALIDPITELLLVSARPQQPGPEAVKEYERHQEIFRCIQCRDAEGARMAMHSHLHAQ
jgi:GntR family transcriptional regulator, transcriptional repressor for pyruvate dehydrogenase complex